MEYLMTRLKQEATQFEQHKKETSSLDYNDKRGHPNQRIPKTIDWGVRCPELFPDFSITPSLTFAVVPSVSQESIVINDLILCLQGISGRYIVPEAAPKDAKRSFLISDKLDTCWVHLARNILPVASYYSTLTRFVLEKRKTEYGKVNHALANSLSNLRNDFLGIVAKFEDQNRRGDLTLHKFYSQIQPYLYSFQVIHSICCGVDKSDARGGRTLSLLHECAKNCTGKEEQLCQHLLEESAVPYMKQLQNWLYHGVITDPFGEFLIEDNQVVLDKDQLPEEYSDDYWGKCYTITKDKIPVFLEKNAEMILCTGKNLNVLRQCGVKTKSANAVDIVYSYTENKYTEAIETTYRFASLSLLQHLMQDNDLIGHLKSVKHYLLFDQGDFFMKFLDMSEVELNKDIGDIVPSRLQTFMELALRTSSANADPYKDNIRTELNRDDILTLLLKINADGSSSSTPQKITKGWESLSLVYEVKWPVSLILNKSSLMIYTLIFRHLFFCKHVERLLCRVWIENKGAKKLPLKMSNQYKSAWDLRQRMLLYVHNLEYYMMVEVIEPNWNIFVNELQRVKTLDEVLACHNTFLTTCSAKCMLTNSHHVKLLNKFLRKCVEFCKFMDHCNDVKASPVHIPNKPGVETVDFHQAETFSQRIAGFNRSFKQHVLYLFKTIGDTRLTKDVSNSQLSDMLYRLDFNSYYKRSVEEKRSNTSSSASGMSISETSG